MCFADAFMCWPNVSFMNIYCLFITGLLEVQMQWMQTLFTVLEMLCKSEAFEFVFTILFRGKVNRTQDNLRPASQTASVGETHPLVRPDWLFAAAAGAACTQISVMAPAESCGKAALCRQAIPAHSAPRSCLDQDREADPRQETHELANDLQTRCDS